LQNGFRVFDCCALDNDVHLEVRCQNSGVGWGRRRESIGLG
jgi:hypothetical protein